MKTIWQIETNIVFEMCCLLNILCCRDAYRKYYQNDFDYWNEKLMFAGVSDNIQRIKKQIYINRSQIISSEICLYFSMISDKAPELNGVLSIDNTAIDIMEKKAMASPYWDEENWRAFVVSIDDIVNVFKFLEKNGFQEYWQERYERDLQCEIRKIEQTITQYNIVEEIHKLCRKEFECNTVEVFLIYFAMPHCIRLSRNGLISMSGFSAKTIAWISLHEMIHTPYTKSDKIKSLIDSLKMIDEVRNKVEDHEKWIGYNNYETYFDEQCTKAADHYLGERIGLLPNDAVSDSVKTRYKSEDDGIHILFPLIYKKLNEQYQYNKSYEEFIVEELTSDKIRNGIKEFI